MLSFLKKLLQQEEPKKPKKFLAEFKEAQESVAQHLEQLQKATLQNTNIPAKAFHYMEGNRESYLRFMRQFLDSVAAFPTEIKDMRSYCEKFASQLNHFAAVSQRNYYVLQNFFANTLKEIGQLLKAMEESVKQLHSSFEKSRWPHIQEIRKELAHLHEREAHKERLERDGREAEKLLHEASVQLSREKERLAALEKGEEWRRIKELQHKLAVTREEARAEEQRIGVLFSPLEKALKKHAKEAFDRQQLVEKYGENPSGALEQDEQLQIILILDNVKQSLARGSLGLDEKRSQKARIALENLTKELLHKHQHTLKNLRQRVSQLEEEIASSDIREKHEGQIKALVAAQDEHERKKRVRDTLNGKMNEIDKKKMLQHLERSIAEKLGEPIVVVG
jgi:hypothetical protein